MLKEHEILLEQLRDVEKAARKLYDRGARPLETVVLRARELQQLVSQRIQSYKQQEKPTSSPAAKGRGDAAPAAKAEATEK